MQLTCIYCKGKKNAKLSREHTISKTVYETMFYPLKYIGTITRSELYGDSLLKNFEPVTKDVCIQCNSDLGTYDMAGQYLAESIREYTDITGKKIPFSEKILGWFIKTHLNNIRAFPNANSKKKYNLHEDFFEALINFRAIPTNLYNLFVEGWEGTDFLWDTSSRKRIQILQGRNVEFILQRILVSDLRIKTLRTFFLIPSDLDYTNFQERCLDVFNEMENEYKFHITQVNIHDALVNNRLPVEKVRPLMEILNSISTIPN